MSGSLRLLPAAILAGLAPWLAGCGGGEQAPPASAAAPAVALRIEFRALWWSLEQMEAFDPNDPPAKQTEVVIDRWEYTDPVGVPHPDTVDVVAIVSNRGNEPLPDLQVRASRRWKIGPLEDEAAAAWRAPEALPASAPLWLAPGEEAEVLVATAEVASLQQEFWQREEWPWAYEIEVRLLPPGGDGVPLAGATATLPIRPGD